MGDLVPWGGWHLFRWPGTGLSHQPVWGFWLVPHRAPPQVADRGTLSKIGEYEDLFLRRTKTSHNRTACESVVLIFQGKGLKEAVLGFSTVEHDQNFYVVEEGCFFKAQI